MSTNETQKVNNAILATAFEDELTVVLELRKLVDPDFSAQEFSAHVLSLLADMTFPINESKSSTVRNEVYSVDTNIITVVLDRLHTKNYLQLKNSNKARPEAIRELSDIMDSQMIRALKTLK